MSENVSSSSTAPKLNSPLWVLLLVGGLLAVLLFSFLRNNMPDQSSDQPTPDPGATPTPETFQEYKDAGLPQIASFTTEQTYQVEGVEVLDGTFSFEDGTSVKWVGAPATVMLYVQNQQGVFELAEVNYKLTDFLQGTPLFYETNESTKTISVRTKSAGQEYKIELQAEAITDSQVTF
jgi:hypothetical protein